MRAVVQRVSRASVRVTGEVIGQIDHGLLVFLGAGRGDGPAQVGPLVEKIVNLRIFEDEADPEKMNRSLLDVGGGLLVVSQFTLYADTRKGRRPSFGEALEPVAAEALYLQFVDRARAVGVTPVATGHFGADMQVELINDGPVTILLDSERAV